MSPKKKYFYSSAVGFMEQSSSKNTLSPRVKYYDTKDLALIAYYKKTTAKLNRVLDRRTKQINVINHDINKLCTEFDYLKEQYPEEFI